jgi:predicted Zn-dependent protease
MSATKPLKLNSERSGVPGAEIIEFVTDAYERGHVLQALRRAEAFAPLPAWKGVKGRIVAARIATHTGAARLATHLSVRAWKEDQNDPEALAQYCFELFGRRGAFALWQQLRSWQEDQCASPKHAADLLALQSRAAAGLRDFANAENLLARAESTDTSSWWIRLQRAFLLECQDRIEAALEVAQSVCASHPVAFYRPALQTSARLLQLLDRDDDAIALLAPAAVALESGSVAAQLYSLLSENDRWSEAQAALDRYAELSPLLEAPGEKWLNAQRARVAYRLGHRADAARFANCVGDDFHKQFAAKLADVPRGTERAELDVTFVRQHFKTCAPATLAAIGRFWKLPAEHLQLAEAMCYDGTPSWKQRDWARQNGWHVREFRVTWEIAVALLERSIPFALATVEATSAHMMAAMGFDRTRGTLLLRDPAQPYVIETLAEDFLQRYRAFGPHGMVFVPASEAHRLEGLDLPESALYDGYHQVSLALSVHDRAGAVAALASMESDDGDAAITWEARLELASYDANVAEQLRCLDKLLELFPNNPARLLRRLNIAPDLSRDARIQSLEAAAAVKGADSALFISLARTLQGDGRCRREAHRWQKRAARYRPMDSATISTLADLLWEEGRFDEATECYRFAANLEGFRESLYQSWFIACRQTRRTQEALEHLEDRYARFRTRSEQPALTLAWAWREMEQPARARQVMEEAIALHPDNGYLLLRAASLLANLVEAGEALAYLDSAKGKVRDSDWLRSRMEIAENSLDFATTLQVARELIAREPLALDAHNAAARALAHREGPAAALAELQKARAQFPHHYGLQRAIVEWSREAGPEDVETAVRELLRLEPSDAWCRRELARVLVQLDRGDEALQEANEAARIEPGVTQSFAILGFVHQRLGQAPQAQAHYRQAIALSVDNSYAINSLLDLARNDEERKADLALIEQELVRQVVSGDGLLAFMDTARPLMEPQALLEVLRKAHADRPDLWHAWSALVSQLAHARLLDEALAVATQASERFPHLPRIWLDLAHVHQRRGESNGEIAAAERAFEINPAWNAATLGLTSALERCGRMDDAARAYERALTHSPRDAQLHACHANLLWLQRRTEAAFAQVERALRFAPAYDWAWDLLNEWSEQSGQPQRTATFAQALAQERSGELRVWLTLARVLTQPEARAQRLAAVERALQLDRRFTEAWDMKAEVLAFAEDFDTAIRACDEGLAVCATDSHILRGRRAWIEAQRNRLTEAVRIMREVLADNAGYIWGWYQLVAWLLHSDQQAEAAAALEQMQKLRPHDAWVHRQLAQLKLKQEDRAGAIQAFAATLKSSPTDVVAAHNLLGLQLEDADLQGAAATLQLMQTHQPGAATLTAEIQLRLKQKDVRGALGVLEELCASPDPNSWPVSAAADAFREAGEYSKPLKILKRAACSASANPEVGAAAVNLLMTHNATLTSVLFFFRLPPGEVQRRTAAPLIHGLVEQESKPLFRWVLARRREVLYADDNAWGAVGSALSTFKYMDRVVDWLSDWRQRQDVRPWMLFNYCLALRHVGRYDNATEVAQHVVDTWGHREGAADMRLFLAVEEALGGEISAAQEHLQHVAIRADNIYDKQMLAMAKAAVELRLAPPAERRRQSHELRAAMAPHFGLWVLLFSARDARRMFERVAELFQREGAGISAWAWFKWKSHWQWLLLPLAPVFVGIVVRAPVLLGVFMWGWFFALMRRGKS